MGECLVVFLPGDTGLCEALSVLLQIISPEPKTRLGIHSRCSISVCWCMTDMDMGVNIFIPSLPHSLLFLSSVEMGWRPTEWTSSTLLEKDFTLQGACGLGAGRSWIDSHLFCRIAAVWRRSIYPNCSPFKLISKTTGLVSSCHACQG